VNRHLVLVGLPGSGKTTVGQHAARLLSAAFSDIDVLVSQATGKTIAALFAEEGETGFRRLERAAMAGALAAPPHVIAPGAGWAAQPGNLETATGALIVYLQVAPEVAAGRLSGDTSRPLLLGQDVPVALRELLTRREPWYQKAQATLDASRPSDLVAQELVRLA
jgi:shikimate kinase